ncbi:MAG: DoxX family protein [Usitatibacter sp.]
MRALFPTLAQSLLVLRGYVALLFLAHAVVRLANGSVPQFGAFLESRGFPYGTWVVMLISAGEIAGALMLAFGWRVRCACAYLAFIVAMGIVLIHAGRGWFVGEHGAGGMEYSWLILAALLVTASADRRA